MSLNPLFVVTQDLDSFFVDRDSGQPLANGILTFYEDAARTVLKPVYTLTGAPPYDPVTSYVQLPNPLTLSAVGTVQDAIGNNVPIYYFPYDGDASTTTETVEFYYITVQSQNGVQQFTREAWPNPQKAINPNPSPSNEDNIQRENQLSNPTFTNLFLNDAIATVFSVSGSNNEFPIGPDWTLVASGAGSISIQRIAITGNEKIVSSPPYVLDVQVGVGISTCYLRQRFSFNSGLWASTTSFDLFLAGSFVARNQGAGTTNVSMFYQDGGATAIQIVNGTVGAGTYQFVSGSTLAAIPQSTNTATGSAGFVDIYLSFTASSEVRISAVQLIPSIAEALTIVPLDLNSSNRDEAYQGDYYIPRLNTKRISSYLVGWDFVVNPFQFGIPTIVTTNPVYVCDQTIVAQTGAVSVTATRSAWTKGLSLASNNVGPNSFYALQYLSGQNVRDMLGTTLSVNVNAARVTSGINLPTVRVYLFRAPLATAIPILPLSIVTLNPNGTYSGLAAGWTEIPRFNSSAYPTAQATLNGLGTADQWNNGQNDFGFPGWQITDAGEIQDTDKFAILVTFFTPQSATILVNSISLVPGDIPCRPAIQSEDEVLSQCQYYYQKSFLDSQPATFSILAGRTTFPQVVPASTLTDAWYIKLNPTMRVDPTVTLFNPVTAANNQIRCMNASQDWTGCTTQIYKNGFALFGTTPAGSGVGFQSAVQWEAEARLGKVV